jgi:hypothetical protein
MAMSVGTTVVPVRGVRELDVALVDADEDHAQLHGVDR